MKIKEIKISNVLCFRHYDDIADATKITFDSSFNILIGENGAGKSTALEVINFIFKRVLFTQFNINQDFYSKKNLVTLSESNKKQILKPTNNLSYSGFRLEPNWKTEDKPQKIQLAIELDMIDNTNIKHIISNIDKLKTIISSYTTHTVLLDKIPSGSVYTINITLNRSKQTFSVDKVTPNNSDSGYLYLVNYNYYKELINFYNNDNPQNRIASLYESFTLIGGYRNYSSFNPSLSLQNASAEQQIQGIHQAEYSRSLNASEQSEPPIFNIVRLRIANKHYEFYGERNTGEDCEKEANNENFLLKINEKLKLVNLKVEIKLTDKRKWQYSFQFFDIKKQKPLTDINSLSSGQKAIIHLIFEAYGRGELKGGLVIIDEPEIHLHHQFQNEYLRVIENINAEQKCQYILVTHSESLINSTTIHKVKRFTLDSDSYTDVKTPVLTSDQKFLVKILDNTRSTYAFFAKKVILVEGEDDRYFFKSVIREYKPEMEQQIAVLDINGKKQYEEWKDFFELFGLTVYFIGDLDNVYNLIIDKNKPWYDLGLMYVNGNEPPEFEKKKAEDLPILVRLDNNQIWLYGIKKDGKQDYTQLTLGDDVIKALNFPATDQPKKILSIKDFPQDLYNEIISKNGHIHITPKLNTLEKISKFKSDHSDLEKDIEQKYMDKIFILKAGSLENYLGMHNKGLSKVIEFCNGDICSFLRDDTNRESMELRFILDQITT